MLHKLAAARKPERHKRWPECAQAQGSCQMLGDHKILYGKLLLTDHCLWHAAAFARTKDPEQVIGGDVVSEEVGETRFSSRPTAAVTVNAAVNDREAVVQTQQPCSSNSVTRSCVVIHSAGVRQCVMHQCVSACSALPLILLSALLLILLSTASKGILP